MLSENQPDATAHQDLIEQQLMRVQSSPHFNHSRRYPGFLNYVVRKTLAGCQEDLKERTIGVEVFGRDPGYDLNADPVVRVTAGEVRKRLAQYYYEAEHLEELRIELRPGSYIPAFKLAPGQTAVHLIDKPAVQEVLSQPAEGLEPRVLPDWTASKSRRLVIAVTCSLLLIAGVVLAVSYMHASALKLFWRPILINHEPVLISVGSVLALTNTPTSGIMDGSVGGHPLHSDPVALSDTIALAKLQEVLSGTHRIINVQSSAQTSFSDLQKGPIILISGFDNPWTMRLTDSLRFHFVRSGVDTFEIDDRASPKQKWSINTLSSLHKIDEDYGLIARFNDPLTEQIVVVAAGIGENGTIAAAQALSDERSLKYLEQDGSRISDKSNLEAVVQVRLIDGKPGPPEIVALNRW